MCIFSIICLLLVSICLWVFLVPWLAILFLIKTIVNIFNRKKTARKKPDNIITFTMKRHRD